MGAVEGLEADQVLRASPDFCPLLVRSSRVTGGHGYASCGDLGTATKEGWTQGPQGEKLRVILFGGVAGEASSPLLSRPLRAHYVYSADS